MDTGFANTVGCKTCLGLTKSAAGGCECEFYYLLFLILSDETRREDAEKGKKERKKERKRWLLRVGREIYQQRL